MQSETTYSGILGKLKSFQMALQAMIGGVPHLEPSQGQDRARSQAARIAGSKSRRTDRPKASGAGSFSPPRRRPDVTALRNVFVTRLGASLRTVGGKAEARGCTNAVLHAAPTSSLRKPANAP